MHARIRIVVSGLCVVRLKQDSAAPNDDPMILVGMIRDAPTAPSPAEVAGHDEHGVAHDANGGNAGHHAPHVPRLSFDLRHLSEETSAERIPLGDVAIGTDGSPIAQWSLEDASVSVEPSKKQSYDPVWNMRRWATKPGHGAPEDSLHWIMDAVRDLALDDIVDPGAHATTNPYSCVVTLPPARLYSRRPILRTDFSNGAWKFVASDSKSTLPRLLCEQFVWEAACSAVDVVVDRNGKTRLRFDALAAMAERGERAEVEIALTNLPKSGRASRFTVPLHVPGYSKASSGGKSPRLPEEDPPSYPVSPHSSCPPLLKA